MDGMVTVQLLDMCMKYKSTSDAIFSNTKTTVHNNRVRISMDNT